MTDAIDGLKTLILDSVEDDATLAELPRALCRFGGAKSLTFQTQGPGATLIHSAYGIGADQLKRYEDYYYARDIWVSQLPVAKLNCIANTSDYIAESDMLKSEVYNDLLKVEDNTFHCVGFIEDAAHGEKLAFGMHRTRAQGPFEVQTAEGLKVLAPFLSHLARNRSEQGQVRGRIAQQLVDAEADPIFVVARDGAVRFANAAAQHMSAYTPLTLREGRLSVSDPGLAAKFHWAVELACSRKGAQKIFIKRQHGDYRLAIDSLERLQGELAVVRLHDLKARLKQKLDAACKAYSLSAAECLLAEALMMGALAGRPRPAPGHKNAHGAQPALQPLRQGRRLRPRSARHRPVGGRGRVRGDRPCSPRCRA